MSLHDACCFPGLDQWCCDLAGDASFEPSSSRGVLAFWMMHPGAKQDNCAHENTHEKNHKKSIETEIIKKETATRHLQFGDSQQTWSAVVQVAHGAIPAFTCLVCWTRPCETSYHPRLD